MLTIEKIKIYNKFNGDIDAFGRGGKMSEHDRLDDDDWCLIDEFEQDVKLISDRLVSKEFREKALYKLNENCDLETEEYFKSKILFYTDFKEVLEIIVYVKSRINDKIDMVWSGFDNAEVLTEELESYQKQIELLDFDTLEKIIVEFLQIGNYQEVAILNGWSTEYLKVAEKFYFIHKRIEEKLLMTTPVCNTNFWTKFKNLFN